MSNPDEKPRTLLRLLAVPPFLMGISLIGLILSEFPNAWSKGYVAEYVLVSGFMLLLPLFCIAFAGLMWLRAETDVDPLTLEKSSAKDADRDVGT